ncbi:predicted protein [Nematostella vectensis]|uniref:G-protein coupled receptors family 1 profile domain-containing protein n=1 Tax=Nematostella vectensis TaxID=45351 RepID=A7SBT6_NEMVE|nr:predicted protein [Nematostella vectensis]|eukprot:XP_001630911.1 predicted protein [Nematostella vectensis]
MNDTRLCPDYLQKYFAEQYDPASWLTRAEYVNLIINTLSTVPAIFLNLLVIAAILRFDTLRSPSFLLICSMAVSDFLVVAFRYKRFYAGIFVNGNADKRGSISRVAQRKKHGLASDESVSSDTSSDDVKLDLSNMADLGNGTSLASVRYRPEETLSLTNSFSEVNLVKYKKIYRTMYLIIALLFAFYAVLVVVTPAVYFVSGYNTCTKLVSDLGVAMIHLNSALNPIIYLVRMREVRAACLTLIKQLKDLRFLPI